MSPTHDYEQERCHDIPLPAFTVTIKAIVWAAAIQAPKPCYTADIDDLIYSTSKQHIPLLTIQRYSQLRLTIAHNSDVDAVVFSPNNCTHDYYHSELIKSVKWFSKWFYTEIRIYVAWLYIIENECDDNVDGGSLGLRRILSQAVELTHVNFCYFWSATAYERVK